MSSSHKYLPVLVLLFFSFLAKGQLTDIVWNTPVKVLIEGNTITKNVNGGTGGAKSANILAANTNGWAEFTVSQVNSKVAFGFINKNTQDNNIEVALVAVVETVWLLLLLLEETLQMVFGLKFSRRKE